MNHWWNYAKISGFVVANVLGLSPFFKCTVSTSLWKHFWIKVVLIFDLFCVMSPQPSTGSCARAAKAWKYDFYVSVLPTTRFIKPEGVCWLHLAPFNMSPKQLRFKVLAGSISPGCVVVWSSTTPPRTGRHIWHSPTKSRLGLKILANCARVEEDTTLPVTRFVIPTLWNG